MGLFLPDIISKGLDPSLPPVSAQLESLTAHSAYFIARQYFESMLSAVSDLRYMQRMLDASIFKAKKYAYGPGGKPFAFRAMYQWAQLPNPMHPKNRSGGSAVAEEPVPLARPDWGPAIPAVLWDEPAFIALRKEAFAFLNLAQLRYTPKP